MASPLSKREIKLSMTDSDVTTDLTKGSIFFIGNATVLIRWAGFTFLTGSHIYSHA